MTGFHVTSREHWNYREGTCGRDGKEFSCWGLGRVPEKRGTVQLRWGCFSELGAGGQGQRFLTGGPSWVCSYRARAGRTVPWVKRTNAPGEGRLPPRRRRGAGRLQKALPF